MAGPKYAPDGALARAYSAGDGIACRDCQEMWGRVLAGCESNGYWQSERPIRTHRLHCGFSSGHFTFRVLHLWQPVETHCQTSILGPCGTEITVEKDDAPVLTLAEKGLGGLRIGTADLDIAPFAMSLSSSIFGTGMTASSGGGDGE